MSTSTTVTFLGGAGTVTGSMHLVSSHGRRVLLDCGLFQGLKPLRQRNWTDRVPQAASLDAVVLSHAHLDHSGYLPRLFRTGFQGPVHCTPATGDLLRIMLPDAAHLEEEQAEHANFKGFTKHRPALPLYTAADAREALEHLVVHPYERDFPVSEGLIARFRRAGHILGSATVELRAHGATPATLMFSGDLGRPHQPILSGPEPTPPADLLLLESTYGDRHHPSDAAAGLARIVTETAHRGGALVIPAFAVGRTQLLLWWLRQLEEAGRIPTLPTYVDSPLAIDASAIYLRHPEDHDLAMETLLDQGQHPLRTRHFQLARTREESRALNDLKGPVIIISASGMATGGRVLHHLKLRLPDPRTTVLLVGFQAAGTRGRALQQGAKLVRLLGADVPVRARIETLDGLSAHADQSELVAWLEGATAKPRRICLVHGEPESARTLARAIRDRLNVPTEVAEDGSAVPVR